MKKEKVITSLITLILMFSVTDLHSDIVYTNLPDSTFYASDSSGVINLYEIDLNDDEITDFVITIMYYHDWEGNHPPYDSYKTKIISEGFNQVIPGPFTEGTLIDSTFNTNNIIILYGKDVIRRYYGAWAIIEHDPEQSAFVGLELDINGYKHYGWLQLILNLKSATVIDCAYNSIPNQPIIAGVTE